MIAKWFRAVGRLCWKDVTSIAEDSGEPPWPFVVSPSLGLPFPLERERYYVTGLEGAIEH